MSSPFVHIKYLYVHLGLVSFSLFWLLKVAAGRAPAKPVDSTETAKIGNLEVKILYRDFHI